MTIPEMLQANLAQTKSPPRWWVAFSGGLDSSVLLHALVQLELRAPVAALHINHQLSPQADAWVRHCERICAELEVPFFSERVRVEPGGRGLEDAARQARYDVFEQYLRPGEVLLTGHHADDQSETLLLHLMRGSGPRGLSSMARRRRLGQGILMRPLLDASRGQLLRHAKAHGLDWIEDESNADSAFDRNFLRAQVIPALADRWPGFRPRWQQSAALCAESEALLEELAEEDLSGLQPHTEWAGWSIEIGALRAMKPARRHNVIRYWLRRLGVPPLSLVLLKEVDQQLFEGQSPEARVRWADASMRCFGGRLYLLDEGRMPESVDSKHICRVVGAHNRLPGGDALNLRPDAYGEAARLKANLPELTVGWRRGGERCRPISRDRSQSLKKLLQEIRLEPWWRKAVPLLYSGETLVAVGDLWICSGYEAGPGEPGYALEWRRERADDVGQG